MVRVFRYRYLGLTPDADTEDIKAAYRRLSKTYHPDTTALPLEVAAQKFVRLKEAYTVLSSEQERRFYDWQLAQEVSKRQGGRFIWPYEASGGRGDDRGPYSSEVKFFTGNSSMSEHISCLGLFIV